MGTGPGRRVTRTFLRHESRQIAPPDRRSGEGKGPEARVAVTRLIRDERGGRIVPPIAVRAAAVVFERGPLLGRSGRQAARVKRRALQGRFFRGLSLRRAAAATWGDRPRDKRKRREEDEQG